MNGPTSKALKTQIQQLASSDPDIEVVWIYGSFADHTQTTDSDLDIAIAFKNFDLDPIEKITRSDVLSSEWSKKLLRYVRNVSIVDINKIPIPLAWEVIASNCVAWEATNNRRFLEEKRIFSRMEIDIQKHRKQYG